VRDRLGSIGGDWSVRFSSAAEKPDSPSADIFHTDLFQARKLLIEIKSASKIKRLLADPFGFYLITIVRHPLEFPIARCVITRISAIPIFGIVGIKLVCVIIQISLCWFGHIFHLPSFVPLET
jgi:hypothetical protein